MQIFYKAHGMRIFFLVLYYFVARYLPRSNSIYAFGSKQIRYWICKRLFAKCGKNVNIEHGADFGSGRYIEIGDNSGIGVNCVVGRAIIGKNVMMGPDVVFVTRSHNFLDVDKPMRWAGHLESEPIIIGDDVWIGTRSIILPARKIGTGVVIGAGSVVTKDVPDYAIAAGNPARVIKYRVLPEQGRQEPFGSSSRDINL